MEKSKLMRLEAEIRALHKYTMQLQAQKQEAGPEQTNGMSEMEQLELENLRKKLKTIRGEFSTLNLKYE